MDEQISNHYRQFLPGEKDIARREKKNLVLISIPGRTQHFAADADGLRAVERLIAELEATQQILHGRPRTAELALPTLVD